MLPYRLAIDIWMKINKYDVPVTLMSAFALTVFAHGVSTPVGAATISTLALIIGVAYTAYRRVTEARPLFPKALVSEPVFVCSVLYYIVGFCSYFAADNPSLWMKEVIQRLIIIFLPMLLFSLMPKKPDELKFVLLSYLPFCALIAVICLCDGAKSGFSKPVFALGMHKNHVAGSCSVLATIAIAALITTKDRTRRLIMLGFLGIGVAGCVAAQGKAGMLCILIAAIMMLIANGMKLKKVMYFVLSVALIGSLLWKLLPEPAKEHVVSTKKFSTNEIRMSLWSDVLPALCKEPFTAVGWGNILVKRGRYYGDAANVLLYDWFQLTIVGPVLLLAIIFFAVKLPLSNARRMPPNSMLSFVNLVALGVICGRFTHGMVDTFWIGRGVTLVTWAAIGTTLFVKLYLDQLARKALSPYSTDANSQKMLNATRAAIR